MKIKAKLVQHGFRRVGGLMLGIDISYPLAVWSFDVATQMHCTRHVSTIKFHLMVVTVVISITI